MNTPIITLEDAITAQEDIGYPVSVGTDNLVFGVAHNKHEFIDLCNLTLNITHVNELMLEETT